MEAESAQATPPWEQSPEKHSALVSIVVLTYNQLEYTKRCIESVRENTAPDIYEIIVVDNHSTDGTPGWLQEQAGADIRCIMNNENAGFPKGCNQGIHAAKGKFILLLHNDTMVVKNWLNNLLGCMNSCEKIAACGPVSNSVSYYQQIPVPYTDPQGMHAFAESYNVPDPSKWERVLKLVGFCLLLRRSALDEVGLFDERYSPGNYDDDDLSLRLAKAGWQLMLCRDTFVHHEGGVTFRQNPEIYNETLKINRRKFAEKWGFDATYSLFKRTDVVGMMDCGQSDPIRVLEVGCACGATLLNIQSRFPHAEIYGLEHNPAAAAVASVFAHVKAADCEDESVGYPENFFDYILFADVLEHLREPWDVLKQYKTFLRPGGHILASIPNVMHYSVLLNLLSGRWPYVDSGILDRTHLRFFTQTEISALFLGAGFQNLSFRYIIWQPQDPVAAAKIETLSLLTGPALAPQLSVYQILISAVKGE